MVKADPKRDYYADLELPATCSDDDIRKQFRLLAKQYHPDRNPGHEVEFVPKFQAVQAAHEVLSDPQEKAKYDAARAKENRKSAPPLPREDPYNFRKPAPRPTSSSNFPPPPKQPAPGPKPNQNPYNAPPKPPASAGAEKFGAFTRGADSWDRRRFAQEEAARADAARRFNTMRSEQPAPPMPPRERHHPTAPRPPSAEPYQNGMNPGFPGMSRAANSRRQMYPDQPQKSAYSYVRPNANRPPPATAQSYQDAFNKSPPGGYSRPAGQTPLRHSRSTEQANKPDRPPLFTRESSRYSSNQGERTDINEPGLKRSASVRNSPVDSKYNETGPFGRSQTFSAHPQRHRSASPTTRTQDFSSDSSGDEPLHMKTEPPRPEPRRPRRQATNDGLEGSFPGTNYTRVVDRDNPSSSYAYPPPQSKGPTRNPFPDMTSPDEKSTQERTSFSNENKPDVFQAAKFSAEDWAERLKSTSPVKRGSTSKRQPTSKSDTYAEPDAMDIDPTEDEQPKSNGVNLDELKNEAPFKSEGLNGMDDLKQHVPFESGASTTANVERPPMFKLRTTDLPHPPKPVTGPPEDGLTPENWPRYLAKMQTYMKEWYDFENRMIEHFRSRLEQKSHCMADHWISMASDGPPADKVDAACNGNGLVNGSHEKTKIKAGYTAYMEWLNQDDQLHAWWDRANEIHRSVMDELGRLRRRVQGMSDDNH